MLLCYISEIVTYYNYLLPQRVLPSSVDIHLAKSTQNQKAEICLTIFNLSEFYKYF